MARLDTGWHAHPKILGLGLQAMGLHAWSISYCDATRSDGFIPHGAWPALPGAGHSCKRLLDAGLWERCDGGFRLHDYLDYNRSREQIEEIAAAMRANGQAGGRASAQARAQANGQAKSSPGPGPGPGVNPVPVPDPTPTPSKQKRREREIPHPSGETPPPRGTGTNPRSVGTNPRAMGTNPRARRGVFSQDDEAPRYEQVVGADGKREWVQVEA